MRGVSTTRIQGGGLPVAEFSFSLDIILGTLRFGDSCAKCIRLACIGGHAALIRRGRYEDNVSQLVQPIKIDPYIDQRLTIDGLKPILLRL